MCFFATSFSAFSTHLDLPWWRSVSRRATPWSSCPSKSWGRGRGWGCTGERSYGCASDGSRNSPQNLYEEKCPVSNFKAWMERLNLNRSIGLPWKNTRGKWKGQFHGWLNPAYIFSVAAGRKGIQLLSHTWIQIEPASRIVVLASSHSYSPSMWSQCRMRHLQKPRRECGYKNNMAGMQFCSVTLACLAPRCRTVYVCGR